LKTPPFGRELWLSLDGRPIPRTAGDPSQRLAQSYGLIYLVAGINVVLGAVATFLDLPLLKEMGLGWPSLLLGALFALLAVGVQLRHSQVALAFAVGLLALDALVSIVGAMRGVAGSPAGGIFIRVLILIGMSRGFGAIRELRKQGGL
jgi:hypothetical protein